jgi:lysophospholipase L1-like esterase
MGLYGSRIQASLSDFYSGLAQVCPRGKADLGKCDTREKDDPAWTSNARVNARNAITAAIVAQKHIPLDDMHALILQHPDMYSDNIHPNKQASLLQAQQVARGIEKLV